QRHLLPTSLYPWQNPMSTCDSIIQVCAAQSRSFVPAFFVPVLYGIPIRSECEVGVDIGLKLAIESGSTDKRIQIMRVDFVDVFLVRRELIQLHGLGDTCFQGAFHSITAKIIRALLPATSEEQPRIFDSQVSE
ncbi:MAG TPA: hypothetical protein VJ324_10270, partial [Candidatus Acidoferrum sp.]|nr:hypothetical protein [Candidatus Acidoferrum sp.]